MASGQLAAAYIKLFVDQSGLSSGFSGVRSQISSTMSSIAETAGGILASIGVTSLIDAVKNLGMAFIETNAEIERLTGSLAVLLKSEAVAAQLMKDVRQMALETNFDVPGLASAVQRLIGVGIAAKDAIPLMQTLGDAASASSVRFGVAVPRLIKGITDMMAASKIGAQDMNQIVNLGIPAWQILAEKMGISVQELRKLSREGKTGIKEVNLLVEALGERYKGMMSKMAGTWGGLMERMSESWRNTIQIIGEPFFKMAKEIAQSVLEWSNSDAAKQWITTIRDGLERVIELVKSGLQSPIGKAVIGFAAMAAGAMAVVGGVVAIQTAFGAIAGLIGPVLVPLAALAAGATAVAESFKMALESPRGAEIIATLTEIKNLAVEIGMNLMDIFGEFFAFIRTQWAAIFGDEFKATNADFWASMLYGIRDFMDAISLLTTNWQTSWQMMQVAAQLGIVMIRDTFTAAIAGMQNVFSLLPMEWQMMWAGMAEIAKSFAVSIGEMFVGMFNGILGVFHALVSALEPLFDRLGELAATVGVSVDKAVGTIKGVKMATQMGAKMSGNAFAKGFKEKFESEEQKRLKEELRRLAEKMGAEREKKREERKLAEEKLKPKPDEKVDLPGKDEKPPPDVSKGLKHSFVGLAEMAKSIQTGFQKGPEERVAAGVEEVVKLTKKQIEEQIKGDAAIVKAVGGIVAKAS